MTRGKTHPSGATHMHKFGVVPFDSAVTLGGFSAPRRGAAAVRFGNGSTLRRVPLAGAAPHNVPSGATDLGYFVLVENYSVKVIERFKSASRVHIEL